MRELFVLAVLVLAACGDPKATRGQSQAAAEAEAPPGAEKIDCAVNGALAFEPVCVVERVTGGTGLVLTIRHPSGGFRRLQVTADGRGVIPADGAESAAVRILDDAHIEVAIGSDRYKLPATIRK
jgi:hypothetical protein